MYNYQVVYSGYNVDLKVNNSVKSRLESIIVYCKFYIVAICITVTVIEGKFICITLSMSTHLLS